MQTVKSETGHGYGHSWKTAPNVEQVRYRDLRMVISDRRVFFQRAASMGNLSGCEVVGGGDFTTGLSN